MTPPSSALQGAEAARRDRQRLLGRYRQVRGASHRLTQGLSAEDLCAQAMPDASPGKWHLAHTSWFFETLVLGPHAPWHRPLEPRFGALFNSYYQALGRPHPRPQRALLTRPDLPTVLAYREHVDAAMASLIGQAPEAAWSNLSWLTEVGLEHEAQHQELMLTDLKCLFAANPLRPSVQVHEEVVDGPIGAQPDPRKRADWLPVEAGVHWIGASPDAFSHDHEQPRHAVLLNEPFALSSRPVTQGEYQAFVDDGCYRQPRWWTSAGWDQVTEHGWQAPLYWLPDGQLFTLAGVRQRLPFAPVCHVSLHEAHAYARWAGARLPTEAEWEVWAERHAPGRRELCLGQVWEWTSSAFTAYPGHRAWPGALAEYNEKFMLDQTVLRGGSRATPGWTKRTSYRNFFPASARWQFSGIRLARGLR